MVSSNQELFDSIKNGGTGIMNEVLREFFKEEIKAGEEQARNEGVQEGRKEGRLEGRKEGRLEGHREGRLEGREEGRIETLYTDCNMSVPDIAKKVSKSEEYVREIIKKISAACL